MGLEGGTLHETVIETTMSKDLKEVRAEVMQTSGI